MRLPVANDSRKGTRLRHHGEVRRVPPGPERPNREEMLRVGASNPVGRLVAPDDIAGAVAFLCSADADMIRGQTLVVDGGFSLLVGSR